MSELCVVGLVKNTITSVTSVTKNVRLNMKIIVRFILKILWKQYTRDQRVLYAINPVGKEVFSAEGFFYWLLKDMYGKGEI